MGDTVEFPVEPPFFVFHGDLIDATKVWKINCYCGAVSVHVAGMPGNQHGYVAPLSYHPPGSPPGGLMGSGWPQEQLQSLAAEIARKVVEARKAAK